MKNMKRSLRRQQKEKKLLQRTSDWYSAVSCIVLEDGTMVRNGSNKSWAKVVEEVKAGRAWTFLRTTGNPCNCYSCSGMFKYNRAKVNADVAQW